MILSIIIPAYNESQNIKITIDEILSITDNISSIDDVQVVVVDDHSSDNTFDVVNQLNDKRIACIRLSRRSGSHTALRAGIRESKGDASLFMCADGQDDPSCIPRMLEKWHRGTKVVWALRKSRKNEAKHIRLPALLFYKFFKWLGGDKGSKVDLSAADFFLIDKNVVAAINACSEINTSIYGLISWADFSQDFVEYERRTRRHGESKWNFRSRLHHAKDWIIAFSGLPLKLMTVIGFFVAIIGFLFAVYIIIDYFTGRPVGGWPTIMVVMLFLGGIQMVMLGVIGEYLWRNLEESRKRPLYFIEKKTDGDEG